jgi:hypothetical protein
MAGELIRWKPSTAVESRVKQALELARGTGQHEYDQSAANPPAIVRPPFTPPMRTNGRPSLLALPRVCAIRDKPYVAYYLLGEGGRYSHSRAGQITKAVYEQSFCHPDMSAHQLYSSEIGEEKCAWCGCEGRGGLLCPRCKSFTCWGKVVNNFWSCRPSCGYSAPLTTGTVEHVGVVPRGW